MYSLIACLHLPRYRSSSSGRIDQHAGCTCKSIRNVHTGCKNLVSVALKWITDQIGCTDFAQERKKCHPPTTLAWKSRHRRILEEVIPAMARIHMRGSRSTPEFGRLLLKTTRPTLRQRLLRRSHDDPSLERGSPRHLTGAVTLNAHFSLICSVMRISRGKSGHYGDSDLSEPRVDQQQKSSRRQLWPNCHHQMLNSLRLT